MKKGFRRKLTVIGCLLLAFFCLCACKAKTAKELKKYAKATHGSVKVISQATTDEHSYIVVKDRLQGFTYTITSSLCDFSIDGASFGKSEHTYDDFDECLMDYIYVSMQTEIDRLCSKYDAQLYPSEYSLTVKDSNNAQAAAEEIAKAMNRQNQKNRLDGKEIRVYDGREKLLGTVTFPTCTYQPY